MLLQKKWNKVISILVIILSITAYQPLFANAKNVITADQTTITAYQQSISLFNQKYNFNLEPNQNIININDIAKDIWPNSINLTNLTNIKLNSFSYDLTNHMPYEIYDKLIGKNIKWGQVSPTDGIEYIQKAKIISADINGHILVKFNDRIEINPNGYAIIDDLTENIISDSGIKISMKTTGGKASLSLDYLSHGLNWQSNYILILNNQDNIKQRYDDQKIWQGEEISAKLTGQITIDNQTGINFNNAYIRLVAGDINHINQSNMIYDNPNIASLKMANNQISEKTASDKHIYKLDDKVNLKNNAILTMPFINSDNLIILKKYILKNRVFANRNDENDNIQFTNPEINFSFQNNKKSGFKKALPAGIVRIMAIEDDAPMLLGEDQIAHMPIDETINIKSGKAFNIIAKRQQITFNQGKDYNVFNASFKITLKNAKKNDVIVEIIEYMPGKWQITDQNIKAVKTNLTNAIWQINVPANDSAILRYSMKSR